MSGSDPAYLGRDLALIRGLGLTDMAVTLCNEKL